MATVVLIEDDSLLGDLYRDTLTAAGHQVIVAHDAQSGLDKIEDESADVIVLDLMLPSDNGVALLQTLRSYPQLSTIPIIIHSSIEPAKCGLSSAQWRNGLNYSPVWHIVPFSVAC